MRHGGKYRLAGIVWFVCVTLWYGAAFAADQMTPPAGVEAAVLRQIERNVRALAEEIARTTPLARERVFVMLTEHLRKHPQIYGAAFAFAPRTRDGKLYKSSPYVFRSGSTLVEKDLILSYDYTAAEQQWYTMPVKLGRPVWSEPYFDAGGGDAWMVTYSTPIYAGGATPQLLGVVTSDLLVPGK